ncbi:hypothetical protein [Desulfurococcus amylolyticus]|uniref:hypothetical protein n=1 Tax=Desulfurococcus amylolyticus TaxID=94694 RepID=UPI00064E635E|nr:hypothetical protein [Desulfurococcus amylolyticus]
MYRTYSGHVPRIYVFLNIDEPEVLLGSRSIPAAESLFEFLEPEALFLKTGDEGSMIISRGGGLG